MEERLYFNDSNYTGHHLHVDNYKDEFTPFIEGIAWVRQDHSMDLFFNDFSDDREIEELFIKQGYYYNEFLGGFIANICNDNAAYEAFRSWVDTVLIPYRNGGRANGR